MPCVKLCWYETSLQDLLTTYQDCIIWVVLTWTVFSSIVHTKVKIQKAREWCGCQVLPESDIKTIIRTRYLHHNTEVNSITLTNWNKVKSNIHKKQYFEIKKAATVTDRSTLDHTSWTYKNVRIRTHWKSGNPLPKERTRKSHSYKHIYFILKHFPNMICTFNKNTLFQFVVFLYL